MAILLPILALGVALDQATKFLVVERLHLGAVVPVMRGFFNLVHIRNRGAAFGLLSTLSPDFAWLFFITTTSLVLLVVGYLWYKVPPSGNLAGLGYSLILAGALGNLIDRVRFGEVIDFLDFYLGRYHWPAFNVADILVCCGAGLLIWVIFLEDRDTHVSHPD